MRKEPGRLFYGEGDEKSLESVSTGCINGEKSLEGSSTDEI
jgi:hypothetical protein